MLKLWATSLILEAALAVVLTRSGGFPALRAFFWYDVLTQPLGIACSGSSPGGSRLGTICLQFPQRVPLPGHPVQFRHGRCNALSIRLVVVQP